MVAVFVANTTKKSHDFAYRVPGRTSPVIQNIPMGQQIKLSGDFSAEDLKVAFYPLEIYGIMSIDRAEETKDLRYFSGIVFSEGKPIPEARIAALMKKVDKKLQIEGEETRKIAAITIDQQLANSVQGAPSDIQDMSVEIIEEAPRDNPGKELLSERIEVDGPGRKNSRRRRE